MSTLSQFAAVHRHNSEGWKGEASLPFLQCKGTRRDDGNLNYRLIPVAGSDEVIYLRCLKSLTAESC